MPAALASAGDFARNSLPSNSMRPDVGSRPPEMILTSVDLPAPLSPSSATTSPLPIEKLMPFSASIAP